MKYRFLGRTGLRVSELGIGGHEYRRFPNPGHFPGEMNREKFLATQAERNEVVARAIGAGVNYFDTTNLEEGESLGLALKSLGRRGDVHIAAMLVFPFREMEGRPQPQWRAVITERVEERLRILQTDYVDVFNVHMPEDHYSRQKLEEAVGALEDLRSKGRVRCIGASSHELRLLAELMRKYDCFDTVMVPYNYHKQEAREVIFPLAKALEVGIVVMKPFSWPHYGIPFMRFSPGEVREGDLTAAQIGLRWILESPEVSTVVPGINDEAELEESLAAIMAEGKIAEEVLEQSLKAALGPGAKDKLRSMLQDPASDIRGYAERALERMWSGYAGAPEEQCVRQIDGHSDSGCLSRSKAGTVGQAWVCRRSGE